MEQDELLRYTVKSLQQLGIRYAIVGSFASGIWGETRFTQDIDIVAELEADDISGLCQRFPADEFYTSEPAIEEAVRNGRPFKIIHPTSGNKIDFFVLSNAGWSQSQLDRRREVQFSDECTGYVAAPEDVILGKLLYFQEGGSEKHLRDIAGILKISGEILDNQYLELHTQELGVSKIWKSVIKPSE